MKLRAKSVEHGVSGSKLYALSSMLIIFCCASPPAHASPLIAFFFDAKATAVDTDNDGGDDYILVQFDVDLDENITSSVTVVASLYNQADSIVATNRISYQVTGQEEGYASLKLIPNPNIEDTYYVHIALSDMSDELYIDDIYYNPKPGSEPIAYFADIVPISKLSGIEVKLDVNLVQQIFCGVIVEANLIDSADKFIESKNLNYETFFEDVDYRQLSFVPTYEDAYSLVLLTYPKEKGAATDSRLLPVLWPPGTGVYFKKYEATAFSDRIEVRFDVDLAYNITYTVSVEAILYNSNNDVAGYGYISYLTSGSAADERRLSLVPEHILADTYYIELIVNVDGYPASYGYIEAIQFDRPRWDINGDNVVNLIDLLILSTSFGKKASQLEYPNADINRDGIVDIMDLVILAVHYGETM